MSEDRSSGVPSGTKPFWSGVSNPIGLIAAFLSLIDVALVVGITRTGGNLQWFMFGFAALFAAAILGGFFYTLWRKPGVFYKPLDYPDRETMEKFVGLMHHHPIPTEAAGAEVVDHVLQNVKESAEVELREVAVIGTIASESAPAYGPGVKGAAVLQIISEFQRILSQATEEARERSVVTITFGEKMEEFSHHPMRPVNLFLELVALRFFVPKTADDLDTRLTAFVMSRNYGRTWVLQDRRTGKALFDIGQPWAERNEKSDDDRPVAAVGIEGGAELELFLRPDFPPPPSPRTPVVK